MGVQVLVIIMNDDQHNEYLDYLDGVPDQVFKKDKDGLWYAKADDLDPFAMAEFDLSDDIEGNSYIAQFFTLSNVPSVLKP